MNTNVKAISKAMIFVEVANLVKWNLGYPAGVEITKGGMVFNKKIFLKEGNPGTLETEIEEIKKLNLKRVFLLADEQVSSDMKKAIIARFSFSNRSKGEGRELCSARADCFGDKTWLWVENAVDCGMTAVYDFAPEDEAKETKKLQDKLAEIGINAEMKTAYVFFSGK